MRCLSVSSAFLHVRKHRAPKGALRRCANIGWCNESCVVRKHRAPKGALRPSRQWSRATRPSQVRKHRAPKGALRPGFAMSLGFVVSARQKAPSAKRCIKTASVCGPGIPSISVRKHRSPKGALRQSQIYPQGVPYQVRKHRAPKGALRQSMFASATASS